MQFPSVEIVRPNFTRVFCPSPLGEMVVWFSYNSPVAFKVRHIKVVMQNYHGPTTGKHLNMIDDNKKSRVTQEAFDAIWQDIHHGILKDMLGNDDPAPEAIVLERIKELSEGKK